MITAAMTLPELVEVANSHSSGSRALSEAERMYLIALLAAYADEVLESGQCVQLGAVVITKAVHGQVLVEISEEPTNGAGTS